MKQYLTIILLFTLHLVLAQKVKLEDLTLSSQKTLDFKKGNLKLKVNLWNRSKDTLYYKSMSCSWQEFYLFDNPNIHVLPANCDKNVPIILVLPPSQNRTIELNIKIDKEITEEFTIGLKIRQTKSTKISEIESDTFKNGIVWASTMYIR